MSQNQPFFTAFTCSLLAVTIAILTLACSEEANLSEPEGSNAGAPTTTGYAEIAGVNLYYEINGAGEPLLLMHGGLGGSEHFDAVIPELANHFRVITVDRRGHGRSHDNGAPYSYAGMAAEMNEFLEFLELTSVKAIGFSDGGIVGYHLAGSYPDRIETLVAVGANSRLSGLTEGTLSFMKDQLTVGDLAKIYPEIITRYQAENPQPENFPSFIERSRAFWLKDPYVPDEVMESIDCPVLFLLGEQDAVTIEHALEMRTLVPDSHLCIIPNANHFLLMEKPELVLPIILDFLAGQDSHSEETAEHGAGD